MVRLHLVTPTRLRLEVLARLNNNRIGEIPFQARAINSVLVRHRLPAEYFALYLMGRRGHFRTVASNRSCQHAAFGAAGNSRLAAVGWSAQRFVSRALRPGITPELLTGPR